MSAASTTLPAATVDFFVVEAFSYSPELLERAYDEGLGLFVWTVNDDATQRALLRGVADTHQVHVDR